VILAALCEKGNSEVTGQPKRASVTRLELIAKVQPNRKHWHAYDVQLNGVTIVADSRDPEHDAARALLARGITGPATVFDGRPRTIIPDIEKAAGYCTKEGPLRFAKLSLPERASTAEESPSGSVGCPRHWRPHEHRDWKPINRGASACAAGVAEG